MSSSDPEHDGTPDAEPQPPTPEPEPLDVDSAFAAIVAGWADDSPATWPAEEDLTLGRHRRVDDPDDPPTGRRAAGRQDDGGWDDEPALSGTGGSLIPSVGRPEEGPEDDIGRADEFVPPEPPPLPRGDAISWLAWAGVILGPVFMLIRVLIWHSAPSMLVLGALAWFVGGFVVLVSRMPKHREDDDSDGAVV